MKEIVKKIINIIYVVVLLIPMFYVEEVNAADNRTIASIRADLEKQKQELIENQQQQQLTEAEIATITSNVGVIEADIVAGQNAIIVLNSEIAALEVEIEAKEEEIKNILNFLQVTNGESAYLEYIFNAQSFTDLIYRTAVTEQLTAYNDLLIVEFNAMIETNKQKEEEIKAKEIELANKKVELENELAKLRSQQVVLNAESGSIESGIEASEELINGLIKDGCYEDETIDQCYARTRQLPSDTSFWRPTSYGYISSSYGWRSFYLNGKLVNDYHYGVDVAGNPIGANIYAIASGKVALVTTRWPGTGNTIYIHHTVNGVNYTSAYFHLNGFNVVEGQTVTKDTVIGYNGNTGDSTGAHLHLELMTGWAGIDYSFWSSSYYANNLNPITKVNFPGLRVTYTTRTMNCSLGSC